MYEENDGVDYIDLINKSVPAMKGHLEEYQQQRRACKFNMSLHVLFEKAADPSVVSDPPVVLISEQMELYEDTDVNELLTTTSEQLANRIETYEMVGSGWIVSELKELDTTVWQLDPLRASTYHPLPDWIQHKKAVRNIKNNDNMCFKWSVLAGLYEATGNESRVSSYTACEVCRLLYVYEFCLVYVYEF